LLNKTFEGTTFNGAAWFDPLKRKIYGGHAGTYTAGILTDVSTIEAKNVLAELLGLRNPVYALDATVTNIATPNLLLHLDTDTIGDANEDVGYLEESEIDADAFSRVEVECILNEYPIVVEDRAAMKASHDILGLKIRNASNKIQKARNGQIKTILEAGTSYGSTEEWDDMTTGVSDHNPINNIGGAIKTVNDSGYPANFMATNPLNWNMFLMNTHIAPMVQAGILNVAGGPTVVIPGYPTVNVLLDSQITNGKAIIGSSEGVFLAMGPTESVRYRHELRRYTGFIIRQYVKPKIAVSGAVRVLTVT